MNDNLHTTACVCAAQCAEIVCREVAKGVKLRRVQTVIVAPNIEQIETEGGLDDLLAAILEQAEQAGIPVVFALSRKKLGQVCAYYCEIETVCSFGGNS